MEIEKNNFSRGTDVPISTPTPDHIAPIPDPVGPAYVSPPGPPPYKYFFKTQMSMLITFISKFYDIIIPPWREFYHR